VNGEWSMVNGQWSMVNGQWSMVNGHGHGHGQWSIKQHPMFKNYFKTAFRNLLLARHNQVSTLRV
jgi:hypothetical protein